MSNRYINLEEAIRMVREIGILGSGYSNEERENDVISLLESVPFITIEE